MRRMFTLAVARDDMKVDATPEVNAIPSPTIATMAIPFTKLTELIVDLSAREGWKKKVEECDEKRKRGNKFRVAMKRKTYLGKKRTRKSTSKDSFPRE